MTQLKDKIKLIAEYDGWKFIEAERHNKHTFPDRFVKTIDGATECRHFDYMNTYLTDLNWLHPVAIKVLHEGEKIENPFVWEEHIQPVTNSAWCKPFCGQHIDLFNAVAVAIKFLNSQKK